jgi:hypothetical protein
MFPFGKSGKKIHKPKMGGVRAIQSEFMRFADLGVFNVRVGSGDSWVLRATDNTAGRSECPGARNGRQFR